MSNEKCCCNCLHCARWKTSKGVECHCDLDDKYLGYLTVMDTYRNCDKWEKKIKWDIQAEHDKQIRADAIDEYKKTVLDAIVDAKERGEEHCVLKVFLDSIAEQLKEQKNE